MDSPKPEVHIARSGDPWSKNRPACPLHIGLRESDDPSWANQVQATWRLSVQLNPARCCSSSLILRALIQRKQSCITRRPRLLTSQSELQGSRVQCQSASFTTTDVGSSAAGGGWLDCRDCFGEVGCDASLENNSQAAEVSENLQCVCGSSFAEAQRTKLVMVSRHMY